MRFTSSLFLNRSCVGVNSMIKLTLAFGLMSLHFICTVLSDLQIYQKPIVQILTLIITLLICCVVKVKNNHTICLNVLYDIKTQVERVRTV